MSMLLPRTHVQELDSPGEYFYNEKTQVLYFWFNSTTPNTPPPNDGSLKVTSTKGLVSST